MEIPGLRRRRRIWAFLPSDYRDNPTRHYPVVYLHDAQNIFEGWKAAFGESWEVHNTMRRLAAEGVGESILIGIEHGKRKRIGEFTPLARRGGFLKDGNAYVDFVANKLKPFVDKKLRTLPEREQTAMVGSSMGGLITLYGGLKHQDVFGRLGVLSPSLWAAPSMFPLVEKVGRHYPMKIYLSAGQLEGGKMAALADKMYHTLQHAGFSDQELYLGIRKGGKHSEIFWKMEFELFYRWTMAE